MIATTGILRTSLLGVLYLEMHEHKKGKPLHKLSFKTHHHAIACNTQAYILLKLTLNAGFQERSSGFQIYALLDICIIIFENHNELTLLKYNSNTGIN